jgi:nitroreductase
MSQKAFTELAKTRRTVYEFAPRRPSKRMVDAVLEAGRWAPSALNAQPWRFILVEDPARIGRLMQECFFGGFHSYPPVLVALVLESPLQEGKGASKAVVARNGLMGLGGAALSMAFAATAQGLDSCMLSPDSSAVNRLLSVPKGADTVLLLGLGFERKGAFRPMRSRRPRDETVFAGSYRGKRNG